MAERYSASAYNHLQRFILFDVNLKKYPEFILHVYTNIQQEIYVIYQYYILILFWQRVAFFIIYVFGPNGVNNSSAYIICPKALWHCNFRNTNEINFPGDTRVRLQSVRQQAWYMVTLKTGRVTDNWRDWVGNVCTLTLPRSSRASLWVELTASIESGSRHTRHAVTQQKGSCLAFDTLAMRWQYNKLAPGEAPG
jgi:hypothetical protein